MVSAQYRQLQQELDEAETRGALRPLAAHVLALPELILHAVPRKDARVDTLDVASRDVYSGTSLCWHDAVTHSHRHTHTHTYSFAPSYRYAGCGGTRSHCRSEFSSVRTPYMESVSSVNPARLFSLSVSSVNSEWLVSVSSVNPVWLFSLKDRTSTPCPQAGQAWRQCSVRRMGAAAPRPSWACPSPSLCVTSPRSPRPTLHSSRVITPRSPEVALHSSRVNTRQSETQDTMYRRH